MPLRPLSYRVVRRRLLAAGFAEIGSRGSHVKFVRGAAKATAVVIVPRHRQIAVGTPRSFIRPAGFTAEEVRRLRD